MPKTIRNQKHVSGVISHESDNLHAMRHTAAHVLAAAVQRLMPETKFGIGPVIENGFYYDMQTPRPLTPQDLLKIEKNMRQIIQQNYPMQKSELPLTEAIFKFREMKQDFKVLLLEDILQKGTTKINAEEAQDIDATKPNTATLYTTNKFVDLCRGPHVESTGQVGAFKLTHLAGAYWRGNENNPMLTRIYGLCFETQEQLDKHLAMLAEAEKRDHRKLGKELELFMVSDDVGKGLPLWLPNGAFIRRKLEDYMYNKERSKGYKYVYTPVLTHKKLYEISGHLSHYKDDMYSPINIEGEEYYIKPMSCPHHHQIYKNKPVSYKDLPLRLAEFGLCHRFERSGVLTGLIRARCFTQNDAHLYCQQSQLKNELVRVLGLFKEVYADFGIKDFWFRLSLPDFNNKEKYGDVENKDKWDQAAQFAREAMDEFGVKYVEGVGEATFYGPKIDVQIKNVLGKEDTIATAQVDFYSAGKFDLHFINEKNEKERPVIIHHAIMGSFDRFFAFLIEQYAGMFPTWLSPVQMQLIPVATKHNAAAKKIAKPFIEAGVRVYVDDANETVGYKIRRAEKQKVPYMLVIGDKEKSGKKLAVRVRGKEKLLQIAPKKFLAKIQTEIEKRK